MRQLNRLAAAAGILAVVTAAHADTILRQRSFDLTRAGDPTYFQNYKTQVKSIGVDDEGLTQARLYFPINKANFGRTSTSYKEDWSPYNILAVKMTNHEAFSCEFRALVYLTSSPSNGTNGFAGKIVIGPGETRRFLCFLNPDDGDPYGLAYMRPVLTAPYNNVYTYGSFRDLRTIYHWRFSYQGTAPARIDISDLRLIKQDLIFDGMVDAFGQYADREWPTKVHSVDDLQALKASEQTDLASHPSGQMFSTNLLPAGAPTGKWGVTRSPSGNAYFQTPSGNLLWALGVSAVNNGVCTPVGGRENYFQQLQDPASKFSVCYVTKPTLDGNNTCYAFSVQNMMLKYGDDYMTPWTNVVKQRMASWGLNMLGMQCMRTFYDNTMPYTQIVHTANFPTRLRTPRMLWGTFPDPYDPTFTSWMVSSFGKTLAPDLGQSNFMGVYVDNELTWGNLSSDKSHYNLVLGVLKSPATQPAKVAFVKFLTAKYSGNIKNLNTAWGTTFSAFSSIQTGFWQPSTYGTGLKADFEAFTRQFSSTYFSSVRSALNQIGFSGLYLGCRYADWLPEVVEPAEQYVDVHTFNIYRTAANVNWDYLATLQKPYMFSELGYSVQGDGTFGGAGEVYSQNERAANLKEFLAKANSQADCAGVILYCYTDQMITGRYSDYQNSGLGLVDVTDTPHYEVVKVLRDFSSTMYTNRG